jgi:hypothetical protein
MGKEKDTFILHFHKSHERREEKSESIFQLGEKTKQVARIPR